MSDAGRVVAGVAAPGVASIVGLSIPIAPAVIAVACALLVRLPLLRRASAVQDTSWTLLAMLGAFVTVVDGQYGPGLSFWLGIGFGAIGSGMAEIGRAVLVSSIKARWQAVGKALFGNTEGR